MSTITVEDLTAMKRELDKNNIKPSFVIVWDEERKEYIFQSMNDDADELLDLISKRG